VWDTKTWERKTNNWVYHSARVNAVAFNSDSIHIASGSLDSSIIVWNVEKPDTRITIKNAHPSGVLGLVWLDGNTLCSVGQDAMMKTWNITF